MEEGRWCFVRQADGYLGWAYRPYLATAPVVALAPTHIVTAPVSVLRDAPAARRRRPGASWAGPQLLRRSKAHGPMSRWRVIPGAASSRADGLAPGRGSARPDRTASPRVGPAQTDYRRCCATDRRALSVGRLHRLRH